MVLITLSTFLAVIVINTHIRGDKVSRVPEWIRQVAIVKLASFLCMNEFKEKKAEDIDDNSGKNKCKVEMTIVDLRKPPENLEMSTMRTNWIYHERVPRDSPSNQGKAMSVNHVKDGDYVTVTLEHDGLMGNSVKNDAEKTKTFGYTTSSLSTKHQTSEAWPVKANLPTTEPIYDNIPYNNSRKRTRRVISPRTRLQSGVEAYDVRSTPTSRLSTPVLEELDMRSVQTDIGNESSTSKHSTSHSRSPLFDVAHDTANLKRTHDIKSVPSVDNERQSYYDGEFCCCCCCCCGCQAGDRSTQSDKTSWPATPLNDFVSPSAHGQEGRFRKIKSDVKEIRRMIRSYLKRFKKKDKGTMIQKEWRIVARVLDRIFFLSYMIIIIISLLSLLPRYEETPYQNP